VVRFEIPVYYKDWKTVIRFILITIVSVILFYVIYFVEGPHVYFLIVISSPPQGYIILIAVFGEIIYLKLLDFGILPLRETVAQKLRQQTNLTTYYIKQEGKQRRKYDSALYFIAQKELLDEFKPLLVRLREWEEKRSNVGT